MAKKQLSMGVKTALTAGTVGIVLMLLRKRAYAAGSPALPTSGGPAGTLHTQQLLGRMVGGSRPGARYEIVGVGIFGQQQGMFRASAKPPVGSILLEVAAYPADPSAEGRQFRLEKTIDRWGATHPTVVAVQQLLDSAWESAALTAVGRSIWHNVNPAAIQALQARNASAKYAQHCQRIRVAPGYHCNPNTGKVERITPYDPLDRERADAALDQMEQEYAPLSLDDYEDAGWSFGADYE